MHKRIFFSCLIVSLLLSGCGATTSQTAKTDGTTTTTDHTTTSVIAITNGTQTTATLTANDTTSTDHNVSHATEATNTQQNKPTSTTTVTSLIPTTTTNAAAPQGNTVTFKVTVRSNDNQKPVANVIISVYTDHATSPAGIGTTDATGVARFFIAKATTYRVVLSNLPLGYEADSEYRFSTNTVNITIRKKAVQNESDHSEAQYDVGHTMTDFALTDTDGNVYRLSELLREKKLVILDFWFATCAPCKSEFPYFEAAVQKYGDDMALLAVNPIDSMSTILALRDQLAISFPMFRDTCNLAIGFETTAFPTTVFIDASGIIREIHLGAYPSEAAFFSAIEGYLN